MGNVTVKPLEWCTNGTIWFQKSMFPRYEIVPSLHNKVRLLYGQRMIGNPLASVESAKAAAQADYEARILSSLSIPCLQEPVGWLIEHGGNQVHYFGKG